jgi:hypothetical protein
LPLRPCRTHVERLGRNEPILMRTLPPLSSGAMSAMDEPRRFIGLAVCKIASRFLGESDSRLKALRVALRGGRTLLPGRFSP